MKDGRLKMKNNEKREQKEKERRICKIGRKRGILERMTLNQEIAVSSTLEVKEIRKEIDTCN